MKALVDRIRTDGKLRDQLALLALPLAFLIWLSYINVVRGPNWIMIPQDLSYNYLLNALNILYGKSIGTLIHPAIPLMYGMALVVAATHAIIGKGDLAADVIADPETYFVVCTYVTVVLLAVALYVMGRWARQGLGSTRLAMLVQSTALMTPPLLAVMNSFGSPESLVVVFVMLQIGLVLATLDGRLEDARARRRFINASAVVYVLATTTKFLAAPMGLLPFLALPTWRDRFRLTGLCGGLGLAIMVPVLLMPHNAKQFLQDIYGLLVSAGRERTPAPDVSHWQYFIKELNGWMHGHPWIFTLVGLAFFGGLLVLLTAGRSPDPRTSRARQILFSFWTMTAVQYAYIWLRPKPHYLAVFATLTGATLAVAALVVRHGRWREARVFSRPQSLSLITGAVAVALFWMWAHNATDTWRGIPRLKFIKSAATLFDRRTFEAPGHNAVVGAIQASNVPTAMEHALQTSRHVFWHLASEAMPHNYFHSAYDGHRAWTISRYVVTLDDLMEEYDKVFFWTTLGNFNNRPGSFAPLAIWRDFRWENGDKVDPLSPVMVERAARMVSLAMGPEYDSRKTPSDNAAAGWSTSSCGEGLVCLDITPSRPLPKPLTDVRLSLDESAQAPRMPVRWWVEGRTDQGPWIRLATYFDDEPWAPLPAWYGHPALRNYRVPNPFPFPHYRLVMRLHDDGPASWPGRVGLYSRGGCDADVLALPGEVFTYDEPKDATVSELIPERFWEKTGSVKSMVLKRQLPGATKVVGYRLATGNDGVNGEDAWGRMPRGWTLEGSSDGEHWTVLDKRTAVPAWHADESRWYPLNAREKVKWVRLSVSQPGRDDVVRIYDLDVRGSESVERKTPEQPPSMTFFEVSGKHPVIEFRFDKPLTVRRYVLASAAYEPESSLRMPRDFELLGSDDGTDWRLLDRRSGELRWNRTPRERRTFTVADPGAYRRYRLVAQAMVDDGDILRVGQMSLYAPRNELGAKPVPEGCRTPPQSGDRAEDPGSQ